MNCENMDNGERPTVLFIFAYQILMKLMNLRMEATPEKGGDSRKKKKRAGTLAKEKKIWLGLQQKKKKRAGTPAREKENVAGTLAKEKENVVGTPAKEKEYMAETPAKEKEKGWDSSKFTGLQI